MSHETKLLHHGAVELKGDGSGELRAVFARFNVIDHDGDVTLPGAFDVGKEVLIGAYGHRMSEPNIGKGVLGADHREAWISGRLYLDTMGGADAYKVIKANGSLQEWSYVFLIRDAAPGDFQGKRVRFLKSVEVLSVDPVLKGAGIGTRTTSIKCSGCGAGELDEATKAELAAIKARAELQIIQVKHREVMVKQQLREQREWLRSQSRDIPVDEASVRPDLVIAAKTAVQHAASALGIVTGEIRWYKQSPLTEQATLGHTRRGAKTIYLNVDISDARTAYETAAHEMKHRAEDRWLTRERAEREADAFAVKLARLNGVPA